MDSGQILVVWGGKERPKSLCMWLLALAQENMPSNTCIYCAESHPLKYEANTLVALGHYQEAQTPPHFSETQFCESDLDQETSFIYFADWDKFTSGPKENLAFLWKWNKTLYLYSIQDYVQYCSEHDLVPFLPPLPVARPTILSFGQNLAASETKVQQDLSAFRQDLERKLTETRVGLIKDPRFDAAQTGFAVSSSLDSHIKDKQASLKALTAEAETRLKSTVGGLISSERNKIAAIDKATKQAASTLQSQLTRLTTLTTALDSAQTGPSVLSISQANQAIEEALRTTSCLLSTIRIPERFPFSLAAGRTETGELLLCVRWKEWTEGQWSRVEVEVSDGVCSPTWVYVTNELELVPFTCSLPTAVQLLSNSRFLVKSNLYISSLDSIPPVDIDFDAARFVQEQIIYTALDQQHRLTAQSIAEVQGMLDSSLSPEECIARLS